MGVDGDIVRTLTWTMCTSTTFSGGPGLWWKPGPGPASATDAGAGTLGPWARDPRSGARPGRTSRGGGPGRRGTRCAGCRGCCGPPVDVYEPEPGLLTMLRDLPVSVRDGTTLRVNVVLPPGQGPFPVLLCGAPLRQGQPAAGEARTEAIRVSVQYRMLRQPARVRFSVADRVGGARPGLVGRAGLRGRQLRPARRRALRKARCAMLVGPGGRGRLRPDRMGRRSSRGAPAPLACSACPTLPSRSGRQRRCDRRASKAICPVGGIHRRVPGPGAAWAASARTASSGCSVSRLRGGAAALQARPRSNAATHCATTGGAALVPALPEITVPALICGSFSDNNLHSRGSFRGWERIASADRFLYTHRGGKWLTFYSPEARVAQLAFFDRYLRGRDVPALPRIRLEVRESRDVVAVRQGRAELAARRHRMAGAVPHRRRARRRAARRGRPARLRHQDRRRLLGMDRPRRHGDHRADGAAAVGGGARHRRRQTCSPAWRSGAVGATCRSRGRTGSAGTGSRPAG